MKEYTVVESTTSLKDLIKKVNDHLKDGWELQGGLVIDEYNYYQTMYKLHSESKEDIE